MKQKMLFAIMVIMLSLTSIGKLFAQGPGAHKHRFHNGQYKGHHHKHTNGFRKHHGRYRHHQAAIG